jgi:hypothetical protein
VATTSPPAEEPLDQLRPHLAIVSVAWRQAQAERFASAMTKKLLQQMDTPSAPAKTEADP